MCNVFAACFVSCFFSSDHFALALRFQELWTLLNLVDAPKFRSQAEFVEDYGDLQVNGQESRQLTVPGFFLRVRSLHVLLSFFGGGCD